jgi:hypothetical protein
METSQGQGKFSTALNDLIKDIKYKIEKQPSSVTQKISLDTRKNSDSDFAVSVSSVQKPELNGNGQPKVKPMSL